MPTGERQASPPRARGRRPSIVPLQRFDIYITEAQRDYLYARADTECQTASQVVRSLIDYAMRYAPVEKR